MEFRNWLEMDEKAVRRSFGRLPTRPYKGALYHGTTKEGLACIHQNGFQLYTHRELCGEFFCCSKNPRAVQLFGKSGFKFDINFDKVLVLNDFYYDLLGHETGMEGFWDKGDKRKIDRANKLGLTSRFGNRPGIDDACSFFQKFLYGHPKFKEVKGIFIPGWDSGHQNAEAEMALTQAGLDIAQRSIVAICIEGQWYEPDEGWGIINDIEVDDDQCWNILGGEK